MCPNINWKRYVDKLLSYLKQNIGFTAWVAACTVDSDCPNTGELCENSGTKTAKCGMCIFFNSRMPVRDFE